jgi:hypothetical protein
MELEYKGFFALLFTFYGVIIALPGLLISRGQKFLDGIMNTRFRIHRRSIPANLRSLIYIIFLITRICS